MIRQIGAMQLSAANVLLAAQQSARPAPQPRSNAFASALQEAKPGGDFAPLDFRQTAAPSPAAQALSAPAARPGSTLDIRV